MKMELTERSETLEFKLQMPANHPGESIQQMYVCDTGFSVHPSLSLWTFTLQSFSLM
jgi:hypothetical protein